MTRGHETPIVDDAVHCVMRSNTVRAAGNEPYRVLLTGVLFCATMMFIEGMCGFIANSLAILSDAVHMLADVFALSISLFAVHASSWHATTKRTYGWRRVEVVGALCSVLTTWALAAWIVLGAMSRTVTIMWCAADFDRPNCEEIDAKLMFGVGVFGLCMNILLAMLLSFGGVHGHSHGSLYSGVHDHDHSHCHSDSHSDGEIVVESGCDGVASANSTPEVDMDVITPPLEDTHSHHSHHSHADNMNMRAALIHVFGDCIQALGVVAAACVIWMGNNATQGTTKSTHSYYNLADPFFSVFFGVITIYTTRNLIKEVFAVLLEQVPSSIDYFIVRDGLLSVDKVQSVDDLHIWSVGPNFNVLSAHLTVAGCSATSEAQEVIEDAERCCKKMGLMHTTIQINHVSDAVGDIVS